MKTMGMRTRFYAVLILALVLSACSSDDAPSSSENLIPAVSISISPASADVSVGGSQTFTAVVEGLTEKSVTWSVAQGDVGGWISAGGTYTAPATAGTYHVVATSVADTTVTAQATVNVTAAPVVSVAISPETPVVQRGQTQQFTATVSGNDTTDVTWEAVGGEIDAAGLYTAPNESGTFVVTARSVADTTKTAQATVTVPEIVVTISPTSVTLLTGSEDFQFTATVQNAVNTEVTWSKTGGGPDLGNGWYRPLGNEGTHTITATSVEDPTKSATAVITLQDIIATVNPVSNTLFANQTTSLTATVEGFGDLAYDWCIYDSMTGNCDATDTSADRGTLAVNGLTAEYTAPVTLGTYYVRVVPLDRPANFAQATIEVRAPYLEITPAQAYSVTGATRQFTAHVRGPEGTVVTDFYWTVGDGLHEDYGVIDQYGLYTAPVTPSSAGVNSWSVQQSGYPIKVTAVGMVDGHTGVHVIANYEVVVSPKHKHIEMEWGTEFQFSAQVLGDDDNELEWTAEKGTIDLYDGLYTAPDTNGTFTITAASFKDLDQYDTAQVRVCEMFLPVLSYVDADGEIIEEYNVTSQFQFHLGGDHLEAVLDGESIGLVGWEAPLHGVTWVTTKRGLWQGSPNQLHDSYALYYDEAGRQTGYQRIDRFGTYLNYVEYEYNEAGYPMGATYYNQWGDVTDEHRYLFDGGLLTRIDYDDDKYRIFTYDGSTLVSSDSFMKHGQDDEVYYSYSDGLLSSRFRINWVGNPRRSHKGQTVEYVYEDGELSGVVILNDDLEFVRQTAQSEACPW